MKALKIIQCSDILMWYSQRVGATVIYLGEEDGIYWSREPAGYKNIILKQDAIIVEVADAGETI